MSNENELKLWEAECSVQPNLGGTLSTARRYIRLAVGRDETEARNYLRSHISERDRIEHVSEAKVEGYKISLSPLEKTGSQ